MPGAARACLRKTLSVPFPWVFSKSSLSIRLFLRVPLTILCMGIAGHQLCLDVFDCYVNRNESNQLKIWWQLFEDIFWLPNHFFIMLSVWKRSKFWFKKYQVRDFYSLILRCCSKLGHCQAFHNCKPGFRSSNPVAAKFMIIF